MGTEQLDQAVADATAGEASVDNDEVSVETLVEEVSIDGMCGVY